MRTLDPVPASSFRQQPWDNGNGRTTELAAGPQRDHWRWRISLAHIDADGPFSVMPGVRRQLAPLDGAFELHVDGDPPLPARRLEVLHVDGRRSIGCHLPDGPVRAFNLMLRAHAHGALLLRPLLDSMVLLPTPGTRWFVFVLAGSCRVSAGAEQLELGTDDAAWIQPPTGTRALIEGGGELALVRLDHP